MVSSLRGGSSTPGSNTLAKLSEASQLLLAGKALGVGTGVHTMGCVVPQDLLHILI